MNTEDLIQSLARDVRPVRRLAPPSRRLLFWLAASLPAVALVVWLAGPRADLGLKLQEPHFALEIAAAALTAITAAFAALCSAIPGRPRYECALPLLPLGLWAATLGHGCWQDWATWGASGLALHLDLQCIPGVAMVGLVPALAISLLVLRSHVLRPVLTVSLAALAAAALGAAGLRLFHEQDASVMVLVWQFGTVAGFSGAGAVIAAFFTRS